MQKSGLNPLSTYGGSFDFSILQVQVKLQVSENPLGREKSENSYTIFCHFLPLMV
jgi:hypothetical protein